jgi:hypothetical protein
LFNWKYLSQMRLIGFLYNLPLFELSVKLVAQPQILLLQAKIYVTYATAIHGQILSLWGSKGGMN